MDNGSPNISRDAFKNDSSLKGLKGETEILNQLLESDLYDGCILHGEGGIGKTRLMLELGFMAEKRNWIVYKITNKLKSIEALEKRFFPGFKYLLIFDYIEESKVFSVDLVDDLIEKHPDSNIKIIANCRNTHLESSEVLVDAENFSRHNLSITNNTEERKYKEHVVKAILGNVKWFFGVEKDF